MPHLRAIRLTNVHFNNATQFYDDFIMDFSGKNTTYDLENGGGKSLLLLMMLQTVLPKTFLRKEKPISLLFQGGKERTSHVVAEWILEEGSQYKYMLTGFCARKKKGSSEGGSRETMDEDENIMSGDIEHLNWCVFYNDHKITGLKTSPLCREEAGKKVYANFDDIRKYIQQMKQRNIPAEVFDRIDRYQSYISAHNLIVAEWNIIKGINSGENNIESYFRQNATSRKLIENQFVKIIEDVEAQGKGEKNNDESLLLADTLIEIRERLNEYLKLKGHMTEFEKIKEYYSDFGKRNDELFSSYYEFESYKSQALGIRNFINNNLEDLQKKAMELKSLIDYNIESKREGSIVKKELEAGLVQYGIGVFEKEKANLYLEKNNKIREKTALDEKFFEAMTLEVYGDYRSTKNKLNEYEHTLDTFRSSGDELNEKYRIAGSKFRYLVNKKILDLDRTLNKLQTQLEECDFDHKNLNEVYLTKIENRSILNTEIKPFEKREQELIDLLKDIQNFFFSRGETEALMTPEDFLKKKTHEISEGELENTKAIEKIKTEDERIQALALEEVKITGEIKQREDDIKREESWITEYRSQLSVLEKKASGFGSSSLLEYKESLELLIQKESINKLEQEVESGRLQQKKQLSEKKGYYVPNEEILSLTELLNGKCEYVKAGIEWISELEIDEKRSCMEKLPFLPFAIIVDKRSFEKLGSGKIKIDFESDYSIPIVNLDTVRESNVMTKEMLFYFCSFSDLVIYSERYKQYTESIEAKRELISKEIEAAEARIENLNNDHLTLIKFLETYPAPKVKEVDSKFQTLKEELELLLKKKVDNENIRTTILDEKKKLELCVMDLKIKINGLMEETEKLQALIGFTLEQSRIRNDLIIRRKELEEVDSEISILNENLKKNNLRNKELQKDQYEINLQLHDLKKEGEQLESFTESENAEAIGEIRSEYKALKEVVGGRSTDEIRLRSEINDFKDTLKKQEDKTLRDYNGDLKQLEDMEINGQIVVVPKSEDIQELNKARKTMSDQIEGLGNQILAIDIKISSAGGELKNILKELSNKDIEKLPSFSSTTHYEEEIKYYEKLVKSYQDEIIKNEEQMEGIKAEIGKYKIQSEHYESFILREQVPNDKNICHELKEYREFESEYYDLKKRVNNLCDKWQGRVKAIETEALEFIIREPIDELSKISRPENSGQCLQRREAFKEFILNIDEQMQKIENDILQLESYQQGFTRRCIQRAELVLGHLRKLEALSRIEVHGTRKSMIELRLQEFEDKEKHLRIKVHIDSIVKEISNEGVVDRKRVATKFSTKELLAQISDMDKAAVRLYKVESIQENSRFYRWENAIGSEGQNNSLYFIFASCLISFIRMLSITNTSMRTKKVIIADNPFGATSAVYLWDPMFKIMKQNDIQLIAPGHRIPREITSRFGVSYLLNQDILLDGRMRVVVKDVRAEEDEDVLRYVDTEQLSLF
jgi:hypothetical protein